MNVTIQIIPKNEGYPIYIYIYIYIHRRLGVVSSLIDHSLTRKSISIALAFALRACKAAWARCFRCGWGWLGASCRGGPSGPVRSDPAGLGPAWPFHCGWGWPLDRFPWLLVASCCFQLLSVAFPQLPAAFRCESILIYASGPWSERAAPPGVKGHAC